MQNSINKFMGSNLGNTTSVGAAGSGSPSSDLGGGVAIQQIYRRSLLAARHLLAEIGSSYGPRHLEQVVSKRAIVNDTTGYAWYGEPSKPGMPLPGNYSGFAGTLSPEKIPASNAFLTGLLWLLILIAIIIGFTFVLKWALEGFSRFRLVKQDRLAFFRTHWRGFMALAVLRTLFAAFFMLMFLTLFQSAYKGSMGVTAVAAIIFIIIFVGTLATAGYACFYRLRFGHYESSPDRVHLVGRKAWTVIPWFNTIRESQREEKSGKVKGSIASLPCWRVVYIDHDPQRVTVHDDETYTTKFGWLASRFRRTRWWFFAVWLMYEFIRACFYGGAAANPKAQVFGLLVVELIAFAGLIALKPFEGRRLNMLVVYLLGASKILVTGLSAAFITSYNLARIPATIVGVIIIVIQGVLTIVLLIAIVVGAMSSYMSLTRNREDFRPRKWAGQRAKYFDHIAKRALDQPPEPAPEPPKPTEPYFSVSSVRRCPKIEDEDQDFIAEISDPSSSKLSLNRPLGRTSVRNSRRNSVGANSVATFTTVPFGARVHRASWSTREFEMHGGTIGDRHPESVTRPTTRGSMAVVSSAGASASTTSLGAPIARAKPAGDAL
jgi:hypothetical protein